MFKPERYYIVLLLLLLLVLFVFIDVSIAGALFAATAAQFLHPNTTETYARTASSWKTVRGTRNRDNVGDRERESGRDGMRETATNWPIQKWIIWKCTGGLRYAMQTLSSMCFACFLSFCFAEIKEAVLQICTRQYLLEIWSPGACSGDSAYVKNAIFAIET